LTPDKALALRPADSPLSPSGAIPMRHLAIHPLLALSAFAFLSTQPAAAASDPDQGERIAQRWCAACHVVAENQKRASADVPSFFDIAKRKTNGDLTSFLTDPHPKMPDMNLSRQEIADITAYIRSLAPDGGSQR
jgi:mono/diheme cytochrome c family protein